MTTLVLGDGLLGNVFKEAKHTRVLSRQACDITSKEAVSLALDTYTPTAVINCAGVVPKNGVPIREMFRVNAFAPHFLAQECAQRDIKFVHISTNCVFKGRKTGNYDETDIPDAVDAYGVSKFLGEPEGCLVVRTSFVGLPDPKGRGLLAWAEKQTEGIIGYDQVQWNGVTSRELAYKIFELLDKNVTGVRHVYSYTTSKFLLLKLANNIFKWGLKVTPESELIKHGTHKENKTLTSIHPEGFVDKSLAQQLRELNHD